MKLISPQKFLMKIFHHTWKGPRAQSHELCFTEQSFPIQVPQLSNFCYATSVLQSLQYPLYVVLRKKEKKIRKNKPYEGFSGNIE